MSRTGGFAIGRAILLVLGVVAAADAFASDEDVAATIRQARDRVFPAVVQIDVHAKQFQGGEKETVRRTGSGVIIDELGHILTNFHVAHRAEKLIVTLVNKERVHATLVGTDHWTDLALLILDADELARKADGLQWAALGDSDEVVIGEPVLAMGTPFGLSRTMTAGIITNNERYFTGDSIDGYETGEFNNWLQTDAAINPGNSGGPLVNARGEVIGINTRSIMFGDGLGFAVPIKVAKQVVRELLDHERVTRSYVGVVLKELVDLEGHFGLKANRGVLIRSVDLSSPAREAGLSPEDVLLAIDGVEVSARFPEELPAIRKRIGDRAPASELELTVKRGDRELRVTVMTAELESEIAEDESEFKEWGLTARSVTASHARREKLGDTRGVLVTGTKTASPAREAGLLVGDIVRTINRDDVTGLSGFKDMYGDVLGRNARRVLFEVQRGVTQRRIVLKLEDG
ncbi:MAG: trypsin-like peptidase domain-containing protein [Phycisphaerae bacterium]